MTGMELRTKIKEDIKLNRIEDKECIISFVIGVISGIREIKKKNDSNVYNDISECDLLDILIEANLKGEF